MKARIYGAGAKAENLRRDDERNFVDRPPGPLTNYSLSTVCPACANKTYRHACKVRCPKCGFMWDCSEL